MEGRHRKRWPSAAAVWAPAVLYLIWAWSWFARFGYPLPAVPDEFSYLLAADTLAHRRLANPTPDFAEFFETVHVLVKPSYASMYPPAQGLWLALGQTVFGHPWWGVVLSSALFVAAAGWAALAWLGPGWALGAGLTALSYCVGTYWSTSYWGGSVAALGGALILGAVGRLRRQWRQPRTSGGARLEMYCAAALWSAGCGLAALARPYEGGTLAALSSAELGRQLWRASHDTPPLKTAGFGIWIAAALPAVAALSFLLAVNRAVTGSAWVLPYFEHARQYQIRRTFYWQEDRPVPAYRHASIRTVYEKLLRRNLSTWDKFAEMGRMYRDHYGSLKFHLAGLTPALLWGGAGGLAWVAATALAGLAAAWLVVWTHPHYYAPFAAFLATAIAGGAQQAARRRWLGRPRPWLVALLFAGLLAPRFLLLTRRGSVADPFAARRAEIIRELERGPERHLILVRYRWNGNWTAEWVYNGADLEGAKVLWARWHEPARLEEFLARYGGRRIWLLEADLPGWPLIPYAPSRQTASESGMEESRSP